MEVKSNNHIFNKIDNGDFEKQIVDEVMQDFKHRQEERKSFEAQWQLNMNFLMGNQYCSIGFNGDVEEYDKQFFWQERQVYNHIAPMVEIRLAKLQRVRPVMTVTPASGDDKDIKTAKMSKKIINAICNKKRVSDLVNQATRWSEVCGTSFYKISWDNAGGVKLDKVSTGDVDIAVVSPFEIYPESSSCERLEDNRSIIHAKAYHIDEIKNIWGVEVEGQDVDVFTLEQTNKTIGGLDYNAFSNKVIKTTRSNYQIVIEKYELPTIEYPNGRMIIIAGDKLLHIDELPYQNCENGRGYPFLKQEAISQIGCFWGTSVIDRVIPIQRAYNTVKNRKHEFLNRLSMGILTVEDGSVDIDNLEEEGLSPGKVLVYRQGSTPPHYMANTSVPTDFKAEEEALLNELMLVSGVSDLLRDSSTYNNNMSGVALQLLIEQDESRLTTSAESIRECMRRMAQHILKLYKQFAITPRLEKIVGDNGEIEVFYFSSGDITSDEVVFETENDLSETLAQRRNMVFDLLKAGLLQDENGKLSNRMRIKALELLGFGIWENAQDINELHTKKASKENFEMLKGKVCEPLEIDEHELHIQEHTAFMLGGDFQKFENKELVQKFLEHIRKHKKMKKLSEQIENMPTESKENKQ